MCSRKRKVSPHSSTNTDLHRFFGQSTVIKKKLKQQLDRSLFVYPFLTAYPIPTFDLSLSINVKQQKVINDKPQLDLIYFKSFIQSSTDQELYIYLLTSLPWYRVEYTKENLKISTPRYTTVFGIDETKQPAEVYQRPPREIPLVLQELKDRVERATSATYNFVLCNYYSSGNDSISYHSDDERFLGVKPTIASLSLGSQRDFYMKNKQDAKITQNFLLESGDLLVMRGETQAHWLHSIPKRTHAQGRINVTFRRAMIPEGTNNYYKYNVGDGQIFRFLNGIMTKYEEEES
ncbi:unnamed protein product [Didymodactylos carnosus]|uniref:Fe2OG dioxygenase domain-containing protein n=1 Tax=Didymodactylos carnosus TaxID=1234261 RepID=A0A814QGA9_9BILA|nr:unnamed protein product [Didymodactylos carnosus]CAF1119954.1 unnamed protein product [Didymodactylos carnosus]CAF3730382.1 unnamed protein product [Didymodactylos carnosus]CAF3883628.1 unnamed protein product [Didymodactylos carnosus]